MENKLGNTLFKKYYLDENSWQTESGFGKPILLSDNGELAKRLELEGITINEKRLSSFVLVINSNLKIRTFNAKTQQALFKQFNLDFPEEDSHVNFLFLTNENDLIEDKKYFKDALIQMEKFLS